MAYGLRPLRKQPANAGLFTASGATRFHINDIAHLVRSCLACFTYSDGFSVFQVVVRRFPVVVLSVALLETLV
jgi:hypothetical protein